MAGGTRGITRRTSRGISGEIVALVFSQSPSDLFNVSFLMGLVAWPIIRSAAVLNVDVVFVFHVAISSASIRGIGARVRHCTTSRNRSRAPALIEYPTAHTMPLKPQCTRKLFYSRRAPYTQTPLPDRATSQHPSIRHPQSETSKRKQPRTAKLSNSELDQSCEIG